MRDVLITGVGLITSLGEGSDQHWAALTAGRGPRPVVDEASFAPYPIHAVTNVDFDLQIPRRGDQRQMEAWQRLGTYAAGLALENAGLGGNEELLARTDMIVAAGGGERDPEVDAAILNEIMDKPDFGTVLNERLSSDLRPTLFLAQLPNLLAGNISIVHKVTGSSRTFMGEEAAGMDAVRTAHARVAAGQSEICLVGGSYNAERLDLLLLFELGNYLWRGAWRPVWDRLAEGGGIVTGSMGAFLILESADSARARGVAPTARLDSVLTGRCPRGPGEASKVAAGQFDAIRQRLSPGPLAVLSGATGAAAATEEERDFLTSLGGGDIDIAIRAGGSLIGHGFEAQFPALVALAALAVERRSLFPPTGDSGTEAAGPAAIGQVLVTSWGHWRGEGMALVTAP